MQTTIYFVRHAHSTYTPDELGRPLSNKGRMDAERVTECLKYEDIHHVVASPFKRARQTVQGIADWIGSDIMVEEGFRERQLANGPVEDFDQAISRLWQEWAFSYEGGESNLDAQKRGVEATIHVLEKYQGKNIVIGTHGNIMVLIMNHFDTKFDYSFWKALAMPDIYRLTFEGLHLKDVKRVESGR
ncbi:histidine phosphatase family protein [Pradoshia sp.]